MDKGLDIGERRLVLAFHAAASNSQGKLVRFAQRFVHVRAAGASLGSTTRALNSLARELDTKLDWRGADRGLQWAAESQRQIVTIFDPAYPVLLAEIAAPPIVLFVSGVGESINDPQIAVVGSRKSTHVGLEVAERLGRALSKLGLTVTSGRARGIDCAAHRGALDAGGRTVAVFGCGIDRIYPAEHRKLALKIAGMGALVSEFPLGSPPQPYHFPRRNKIISGLSYGTVVLEVALKSGSVSTARHALEQGREVFAVPGSVRNSLAAGCHRLIKQGATLVDTIDDIVEQLPAAASANAAPPTERDLVQQDLNVSLNAQEQCLLEACGFDPATFDEVMQRSGLTALEVSSILFALEVRGLVRSLAGNTYLKTTQMNALSGAVVWVAQDMNDRWPVLRHGALSQ
jgi:DNA processing protein